MLICQAKQILVISITRLFASRILQNNDRLVLDSPLDSYINYSPFDSRILQKQLPPSFGFAFTLSRFLNAAPGEMFSFCHKDRLLRRENGKRSRKHSFVFLNLKSLPLKKYELPLD